MLQSVLRTKIIPPPRHARTLARPRVINIFMQAFEYRLTILQAEAGYGKSTALAELAETTKPLSWYQINEEDNDPLVFLLHLCHAFLQAPPMMIPTAISTTFPRMANSLNSFNIPIVIVIV